MIDVLKIKNLFLSTGEKEEIYAASIGISQSHFSNCLHGVKHFSATVLANIAKKHKCKVPDLLTDDKTDLHEKLHKLRLKKLTKEELEGIQKIGTLLEIHSLIEDEDIRNEYYELLNKIMLKI